LNNFRLENRLHFAWKVMIRMYLLVNMCSSCVREFNFHYTEPGYLRRFNL